MGIFYLVSWVNIDGLDDKNVGGYVMGNLEHIDLAWSEIIQELIGRSCLLIAEVRVKLTTLQQDILIFYDPPKFLKSSSTFSQKSRSKHISYSFSLTQIT